ncbi:hypothetical protein [Acidipropionibacterium jensenii]|uniref:hypothetical protein n=1 Tax=Acidipropionibacterium jensenii TaxID=1749 RepID=UPI00214CA98D|nr:hypothetical protein [Acidipropionibacterium jensenii]
MVDHDTVKADNKSYRVVEADVTSTGKAFDGSFRVEPALLVQGAECRPYAWCGGDFLIEDGAALAVKSAPVKGKVVAGTPMPSRDLKRTRRTKSYGKVQIKSLTQKDLTVKNR